MITDTVLTYFLYIYVCEILGSYSVVCSGSAFFVLAPLKMTVTYSEPFITRQGPLLLTQFNFNPSMGK